MLAIVAIGVLGGAVGAYLPGVARRVPDGRPVLARSASERSIAVVAYAVATAAIFAALAARFGWSAELPAFLYLGALSVPLTAIDLRHHRLPDALTLPSYPIAGVLFGLAALVRVDVGDYLRALLAMAALFVLYALMHLIYPAGMGFGDVKLAGLVGMYLGWLGWDVLLVGAALGFTAGGVTGVALLAMRRATRKSAIPYGPLMLVGAFIAILWGEQIASWYAGT